MRAGWALAAIAALGSCGVLAFGVGAAQPATTPVRTLDATCNQGHPCHFAPGWYRLGLATVLPGLRLKLQKGWSSTEDWSGSLALYVNAAPHDILSVWLDMEAVKSSGHGHGTTVLHSVGKSPTDLVKWLTHNHDFQIVSPATATTLAGNKATTLTVGVSKSARYGDKGCPANPRCADLFTNPTWNDWFGIGGHEQVRLYLASIKTHGTPHTLIIVLDAANAAQLQHLATAARQPTAKSRSCYPFRTSSSRCTRATRPTKATPCESFAPVRRSAMPEVETTTPPNTPTPIGPYNHVAKVGNLITIGGTAGVDPATGSLAGDDVGSQTSQILDSFRVMLESVGSDLDHIVHVNIFLGEMSDFEEMNVAYVEKMGEHRPARTVIGVRELPKPGVLLTMNLTAVTVGST
jgi:2-iminobutanoate/2-iminopropanoate deaminase